jgi:copper chaperone CopZ
MKKFVFTLLASSTLVLISCNSSGEKKILNVEKHVEKEQVIKKVVPNNALVVEISGMTCEHGCGGSIRSALIENGGVNRVSFDFNADREVNTATITYNDKDVTTDEMIAVIQQVNDGQYKTGKVTPKPYQAETK